MIISNYGQERDLVCTEPEREIFDIICKICGPEHLRLIRRSDNYVSAVMPSSKDYGDMDLARIKFTDRAKWIQFAPDFDKVKLSAPEDVADMADAVLAAYRFNEPYL